MDYKELTLNKLMWKIYKNTDRKIVQFQGTFLQDLSSNIIRDFYEKEII